MVGTCPAQDEIISNKVYNYLSTDPSGLIVDQIRNPLGTYGIIKNRVSDLRLARVEDVFRNSKSFNTNLLSVQSLPSLAILSSTGSSFSNGVLHIDADTLVTLNDGTNTPLKTTNWTIGFWVKMTNSPECATYIIKESSDDGETGWMFFYNGVQFASGAYYFGSGGDNNFIDHGNIGGWDYIAVSKSNTTITIYLNGQLGVAVGGGVNPSMMTGYVQSPSPIELGGYFFGSPMPMDISSILITNRCLSSAEIGALVDPR